jgi:hypothetical protein
MPQKLLCFGNLAAKRSKGPLLRGSQRERGLIIFCLNRVFLSRSEMKRAATEEQLQSLKPDALLHLKDVDESLFFVQSAHHSFWNYLLNSGSEIRGCKY